MDLLFLVAISDIMEELAEVIDTPWMAAVMECFTHKKWEGFSPWDLVMPLFMFMAGVAIPYSLGKYREEQFKIQNSKFKISNLYWRLGKRVLLLWIFGMMVQGNLMALDPDRIYLFTNTLQAIAVGYFFSAIIYMHTSWKTQIGIAVALLLTFWGAMEFITIGGYGGGDYTPHGNLAEGIDMMVLGRFRDTAQVIDGEVVVKTSYTYTWILSSLNFVVTVLSGVLAGEILKGKTPSNSPSKGRIQESLPIEGEVWRGSFYDKHHLFSYGGETENYTPGNERVTVEWRGVRFRLSVCYDLRFPLWLRNKDDYDVLICVASWPAVRTHAWQVLLQARAIENQCYVLGVNRIGKDPVCEYSGSTCVVDPFGFATFCPEGEASVVTQTLDLKRLKAFREKFPVLKEAD